MAAAEPIERTPANENETRLELLEAEVARLNQISPAGLDLDRNELRQIVAEISDEWHNLVNGLRHLARDDAAASDFDGIVSELEDAFWQLRAQALEERRGGHGHSRNQHQAA